jgi:hypothetical protein
MTSTSYRRRFLVAGIAAGAARFGVAPLRAEDGEPKEKNDYVTSVTRAESISSANARPLADALDGLVLMYRHHAALEDAVVFPSWKEAVSAQEYDELTDRFEELERQMFGKDGFEDAVARITAIEQTFGAADLAAFTAPMPPKPKS